ncbi:hypothetical protein D9611_003488 [Ephemerocybe angulata]|uniref:MYND-type domain-containing protein n=1 Tax=Ephemerocybe angulata TaxID=980116 RepID=A0A8H5B676_9AGAR|nr:hypothetical protein D9611_003488 [Tulosesus angulatus]
MASCQVSRPAGQRLSIIDDTPSDVWYEIAMLSYPPEIASLQSTCRALKELLFQKQVWGAALKAMCRQNRLFLPSYPMERMSVMAIQSVVARMESAQSLMKTPATKPVGVTDRIKFRNRPILDSGTGVFLVPGGRFLVTFDGDALTLWDIGVAGGPPTKPSQVTQIAFPPGTFPMHRADGDKAAGPAVSVRMRGNDLRVVIAYGRGTVVAKAFDLVSVDTCPTFTLLGSVSIDASHEEHIPCCKELDQFDDRALITVGNGTSREFIVWNFVQSSFSVIYVFHEQIPSTHKVFLTKTHIVELVLKGVVSWLAEPSDIFGTRTPIKPEDPPISPLSHMQHPLECIAISYPHLANPDTFLSTMHKSRVRIANIHGGQLPLTFDIFMRMSESEDCPDYATDPAKFMAEKRKEKDVVVRYQLDVSLHPPDAEGNWTTLNLETISTSMLPGPETTFMATDNPTGFFAPDPFFASLANASNVGKKNLGSLLATASFATYFIYSPEYPGMGDNFGLTKPRRACDREGCYGREDRLDQLKRCSGCQMVLYCGAPCQNEDWKGHKADD